MKITRLKVMPVAEGIWRLVLPLPFVLSQVNIWLIEGDDGWTVVDTGFGDQATKQFWLEVFDGIMADKPLERIILTHHHIDHCALAGWLSCGRDTVVCLTEPEAQVLSSLEEPAGYMHKGEREGFQRQHGLTWEEVGVSDAFFDEMVISSRFLSES